MKKQLLLCLGLVALLSAMFFYLRPQNDLKKKAGGLRVQDACRDSAFPTLVLFQRNNREKNIEKLLEIEELTTTRHGKMLRKFYQEYAQEKDHSKIVQFAEPINFSIRGGRGGSENRWAIRENRIKMSHYFLEELKKKAAFLLPTKSPLYKHLAEEKIIFSVLEEEDMYGAMFAAERSPVTGDWVNYIGVSSHPSESFPYMVTLIIHELIHAVDAEKSEYERFKIFKEEGLSMNYLKLALLSEARAFEEQISFYVEAAKQEPQLFCDFIQPTFSYGDIPVPVSWILASMEYELKQGNFIHEYLKAKYQSMGSDLFDKHEEEILEYQRAAFVAEKFTFVKPPPTN